MSTKQSACCGQVSTLLLVKCGFKTKAFFPSRRGSLQLLHTSGSAPRHFLQAALLLHGKPLLLTLAAPGVRRALFLGELFNSTLVLTFILFWTLAHNYTHLF